MEKRSVLGFDSYLSILVYIPFPSLRNVQKRKQRSIVMQKRKHACLFVYFVLELSQIRCQNAEESLEQR